MLAACLAMPGVYKTKHRQWHSIPTSIVSIVCKNINKPIKKMLHLSLCTIQNIDNILLSNIRFIFVFKWYVLFLPREHLVACRKLQCTHYDVLSTTARRWCFELPICTQDIFINFFEIYVLLFHSILKEKYIFSIINCIRFQITFSQCSINNENELLY